MTNQFLLVGSIVVPLVVLFFFGISYLERYKQYLKDKREYSNLQSFSDFCKAYVSVRVLYNKLDSSKFWKVFFEDKYLNLLNYLSQGLVYELDQLDRFCVSSSNRKNFYARASFLDQWAEVRRFLYYDSRRQIPSKLKDEFGKDPFGYGMMKIIGTRITELLAKEALMLLRRDGYWAAEWNLQRAWLWGYNAHDKDPLHKAIISKRFLSKIVREYDQEFIEKIKSEMNKILSSTSSAQNKIQELKKIESSFPVRESFLVSEPIYKELLEKIEELETCEV